MVNTPNLAKAFQAEAEGLVEDGLKNLEENWMNREAKACKNCKGKGIDPEDFSSCIACDGTGVDMYIEYGVEDGKFVAKVIQNGAEAIADLCKEYREVEANMSLINRANRAAMVPFLLPESVKMDLEISEPMFKEFIDNQEYRKAANIVRRRYPQYMTTRYIF